MAEIRPEKILFKPWAYLFFKEVFENIDPFYRKFPKTTAYLKYLKEITFEEGKVTGIYTDSHRLYYNVEITFKKFENNSDWQNLYSICLAEDLIETLNEPALQQEFYKILLKKNTKVIPNWHDINISCSCGYFDYFSPCQHVRYILMRLFQEISKDYKILLLIQGINLKGFSEFIKLSKQETPNNVISFENYINKNNTNSEIKGIIEDKKHLENISISEIQLTNFENNEELQNNDNTELIENTLLNNNIHEIIYDEKITENGVVYKSRIGQNEFRNKLLNKYNGCLLCSIKVKDLLNASHIKPWSISNNKERLDVNNGLLLCALHDRLFDLGFISFDNNGNIIISKEIQDNMYEELKINNQLKISIYKKMEEYINWHREKIFRK